MVEGEDDTVVDAANEFAGVENGEGGLAAVVGQEKAAGGGDAAPVAADGATNESAWSRWLSGSILSNPLEFSGRGHLPCCEKLP